MPNTENQPITAKFPKYVVNQTMKDHWKISVEAKIKKTVVVTESKSEDGMFITLTATPVEVK